VPGIQAAVWGSGTYDYEHTTGTFNGLNIGSNSRAWGGLGGVDLTIPGVNNGTFLVGFLGGETDISISTPTGISTKVRSPTAGTYIAYIVGNFSTDLSYTASWISSNATTPIAGITVPTANSISNNFAGNMQYRFNLANNWWLEPTAGFTWTYTALGNDLPNQEILRVQGGGRAGTSFRWGAVTVEPSFTGLAYSDVSVTGGIPNGAPPVSTDQGQLWGKVIAKFNFVWSQNFSSYIQGEIHGTNGTENTTGYVASVGARWVF
jgi:hypothetical protein